MKLIKELLKKAIFFKSDRKGWEDLVQVVEDVGQCSTFPENFKNEEDSAKAEFYKIFRNEIGREIYKKDRAEYWQRCERYVELEMQKRRHNLSEIKKDKAYKR